MNSLTIERAVGPNAHPRSALVTCSGKFVAGREKVVVFSGIEEAVVVIAGRGSGCGWAE